MKKTYEDELKALNLEWKGLKALYREMVADFNEKKFYAWELSAEERQTFVEHFYRLWDDSVLGAPDVDSDLPWGCPWLDEKVTLSGDSLEKMAHKYFEKVFEEIRDIHNRREG